MKKNKQTAEDLRFARERLGAAPALPESLAPEAVAARVAHGRQKAPVKKLARRWTAVAVAACLLLGIIFDPIDGGITKDHCNLSYMLSAGGLACLMSSFLLWCESRAALRGRTLSKTLTMTGQNPMVAYTVTWFVILPLLSACGFGHFMAATVGSPVLGLLQGVILTGLMVVVTCLLTRARIFWRS